MSPAVNKPENNWEECVDPISLDDQLLVCITRECSNVAVGVVVLQSLKRGTALSILLDEDEVPKRRVHC